MPSNIVYGILYALAIIAISFAVIALLVSRQLRILEERRKFWDNAQHVSRKETPFQRIRGFAKKRVEASGIKLSLNEFMSVWGACATVAPIGSYVAGWGLDTAALMFLLGAGAPILVLEVIRRRNEKRFETLLGQTMPLIAANLRGGATLSQAMGPVAENMDEPIKSEFARLRHDIDRGMPIPDAIEKCAKRNNSADLKLFASAVRAQMKTGGSLAEIVDSVATTIQQRCEIRQMIASKTSQAKTTARLMCAIPPILAVAMAAMNDMYQQYFMTPMGWLTIAGCALLETAGYVIAMKMCDIKTD